ncbi:UNVERIFIED_CONTAM: hypothetical protein FKN15_002270 [Acipenser sinensis]
MTADDMMISVDGDESSCCSFNESLVQAGEDSGSCTTSASSSLSTPSPGISAEDVNAKKGAAHMAPNGHLPPQSQCPGKGVWSNPWGVAMVGGPPPPMSSWLVAPPSGASATVPPAAKVRLGELVS